MKLLLTDIDKPAALTNNRPTLTISPQNPVVLCRNATVGLMGDVEEGDQRKDLRFGIDHAIPYYLAAVFRHVALAVQFRAVPRPG